MVWISSVFDRWYDGHVCEFYSIEHPRLTECLFITARTASWNIFAIFWFLSAEHSTKANAPISSFNFSASACVTYSPDSGTRRCILVPRTHVFEGYWTYSIDDICLSWTHQQEWTEHLVRSVAIPDTILRGHCQMMFDIRSSNITKSCPSAEKDLIEFKHVN